MLAGLHAGLYPSFPEEVQQPAHQTQDLFVPSQQNKRDSSTDDASADGGGGDIYITSAGAAVVAVLAIGIGFAALAKSVLTSVDPNTVRSYATVTTTLLVPAVVCFCTEKSLASQSVVLYLVGMTTAAIYTAWLVLRLLSVHLWSLGLTAHACLLAQMAACGGLGWILNWVDELRSKDHDGRMRCYQCHGLFVPPPHAPIVSCPFCGTHNRVQW